MDSDLEEQPRTNSSGLTRYRSAPSSYFNDAIDREFYEHIFNRPSSPETERVFSRFMNSLRGEEEETLLDHQIQKLASPKQEINQEERHAMGSSSSMNNNNYEFYQKPPLPNQNVNSGGGGNNNNGIGNLIRHSSSPAGFFSQFNIQNEYAAIRNMGTLGAVANNSMEEAKFSNARSLKNPQNYSSVRMSSIAEIGDRVNRENNPQSENFADEIMTGFGSWDDSSIMPDNAGGLKRFRDNDVKPFSTALNLAKTQNETGQCPAPLSHQMSLPNTSAEMAAIEKFLQFSDSVPCKIRAKRGCATHPRSIAERVRRTKISERMRKLQDLVPNMDKQTNTADMLDLAVDYIKDLQKQVQTLSDCHAKCTCSHERNQ